MSNSKKQLTTNIEASILFDDYTNKIAAAIQKLLYYGIDKLGLKKTDFNYALNAILDVLSMPCPFEELQYMSAIDQQKEIFDVLTDYGISAGLIKLAERVNFETRLIGCVMPPPSQIIETFERAREDGKSGAEKAAKYLYDLGIDSNYIRMSDISKNLRWPHKGKRGELVITINIAKPEKTAEQILAEKNAPKSNYPKCLLCVENEGYAGNLIKAARQTLRIMPITLNGEKWGLQFSPYQYYREHCIALSSEHRPMAVDGNCLSRLLDFAKQFPHYFIGSNAALPIVGGSILSHDHYQGGGKELPLFKRGSAEIKQTKYPDVKISRVDWYNSVVRIESENNRSTLESATNILEKWQNYSDEKVGILSHTNNTPHNAVTPIARFEKNKYIIDLILRNNRTSDEFPDGIFHSPPCHHNIKKEGIGIIEAAGIFILPGRLKAEVENNKLTKDAINSACEEILEATAVFKNTLDGDAAFEKFLNFALA